MNDLVLSQSCVDIAVVQKNEASKKKYAKKPGSYKLQSTKYVADSTTKAKFGASFIGKFVCLIYILIISETQKIVKYIIVIFLK